MNKAEWIVFIVFSFIGFIISFDVSSQNIKMKDQQARDHYYECIEKTNDIQWCFINFKPDIK